jgi:natural product biosynthesis luciferase-like monooxygenase protein
MKFGLMFFASTEDALVGDKYRLVVESARFGDRNGFSSVWVPERHFTRFGSLYPNPAVLHAALAMTTERIRLHAGSVVAPLHNPIRIAEEWAVVDNLSHGRIGISFASGWNPDDFAFFPERYSNRHEEMYKNIRMVQRIWRGETLQVRSGNGKEAEIRIYPTPLQNELPIWITAAGNPRTYTAAGEMNANLLTHILDQDIEQLAEKITLYRDSRARAGFDPAGGQVTLMLHTFVGEDLDLVREQARRPFCEFIKSNIGLLGGLAQSRGRDVDVSKMSEGDLNEFVGFLYERFSSTRGLIGTPESTIGLVGQLEKIGVDEVACLLDFGPDKQLILNYLPHLNRLKNLYTARSEERRFGVKGGVKFLPNEIKAHCSEQLTGAEFHSLIEGHGVQIDSSIRFVERVWRRDGEALAKLHLRSEISTDRSYITHPAYLDACGRVLAAALPRHLFKGSTADLYLPDAIRMFKLYRAPEGTVWSHALFEPEKFDGAGELIGDVFVYDELGSLLLEIKGLQLKRALPEPRNSITDRRPPHDALTYCLEWQPIAFDAASDDADTGERQGCLILADRGGLGKRLAELLELTGRTCFLVYEPPPAGGFNQLIEEVALKKPMFSRIVHLWSLDSTPSGNLTMESLLADQERSTGSALHLIQALAAHKDQDRFQVYFVTRGGAPISPKDYLAIAQSPLWGLGRAVAAEHRNLWGGLIDLDPYDSINTATEALMKALLHDANEDMLGVRAGRYYVARLRPQPLPPSEAPLLFSQDATFLVTGGLGGLGRRLALWLSERGARHLCLVSRSASEEHAGDLVDELRRRGVDVLIASADVAREQDLQRVLRQIAESMPPLRGIFHLAGTLDDALLVQESWQRFTTVRAAKLEGAWNLHQLTSATPLDFFVMFSSAASLLTTAGQANYAMANTFLDALAHHRRSLGLHALSVNWGPWAESGHAETRYGRQAHARLDHLGIHSISSEQGLDILGILLERDFTQIAVIAIEWDRLFQNDPAASKLAMFSELAEDYEWRPEAREETETEVLQALRALPESEHHPFLMDFLSQAIARTLKLGPGFVIEPQQKLFELGLDSIMAIEMKNRLERSLGRSFSATLLFLHPTVEGLADHLLREVIGPAGDGGLRPAPKPADEPLTVGALSEEQMVELLLREIDAGQY